MNFYLLLMVLAAIVAAVVTAVACEVLAELVIVLFLSRAHPSDDRSDSPMLRH